MMVVGFDWPVVRVFGASSSRSRRPIQKALGKAMVGTEPMVLPKKKGKKTARKTVKKAANKAFKKAPAKKSKRKLIINLKAAKALGLKAVCD